MKIEHLREFIVLCESMNFTKAAKELYITQPALSTHVSSLEKDLGVELLARDQHRIRLTKFGKIFLEQARIITAQYETLIKRIEYERQGITQELRIGYLHNAYRMLMPTYIRKIKSIEPTVQLTLYADGFNELEQALINNQLEVVFSIDCDERLYDFCEVIPLKVERHLFAAPLDSPWAERESITTQELESIPIIFPDSNKTGRYEEWLSNAFKKNNVNPTIVGHYYDVFSRSSEMTNADACTLVMAHFANDDVDAIKTMPIVDGDWDINLAMIWKKSNTSKLIQTIRDVVVANTL